MRFIILLCFYFLPAAPATGQDTTAYIKIQPDMTATTAYIKIQPDMTATIKYVDLTINGCFISDSTIIKEWPQYISKTDFSKIKIIPREKATEHYPEAKFDILSIKTKHIIKLKYHETSELFDKICIPCNLYKAKRIRVSVFRKNAQNGRYNTRDYICDIDNTTKYYYHTKNGNLCIVIFINH